MGKTVEKAVFQIQHGRKVATKAEKLHALQLHQLHLLSLIAHYEHINHVLNHKLVQVRLSFRLAQIFSGPEVLICFVGRLPQAFALSTVPSSLIEALEDIDNVKGPITDLVDWIYHTFPVASDRPNSPSTPYTFLRLFTNSATNENAPSISYSTVPLVRFRVSGSARTGNISKTSKFAHREKTYHNLDLHPCTSGFRSSCTSSMCTQAYIASCKCKGGFISFGKGAG
jgi:hypothetical protein